MNRFIAKTEFESGRISYFFQSMNTGPKDPDPDKDPFLTEKPHAIGEQFLSLCIKEQDMIDRFLWNINILMIQIFFYKVLYGIMFRNENNVPAKFHSELQIRIFIVSILKYKIRVISCLKNFKIWIF